MKKLSALLALVFAVTLTFLITANFQAKKPAHEKPRKPPKTLAEKELRKSLGLGPLSAPSEWFFQQRAFPYNTIDEAVYHRELRQAQLERQTNSDEINETWELAGPVNVGGRITALAWDPRSNNGPIYAGAAFGGVWKSAGTWPNYSWSQVFNNAGGWSIGAIALAPTAPDTIYVGTGEANSAQDTYGGNGLWFSGNGGMSWEHRGLDSSAFIGKIAVHPREPATLYAACLGKRYATNPDRGLYKSVDAGETWSRVLAGVNDTTGCIDVAIDPYRPDTIYAAMWQRIRNPFSSKFYGIGSTLKRSPDGGQTWTEILPPTLRNRPWCRIGVAVSKAQQGRLFCSVVDSTLGLHSVWRSDNYGNTWIQLTNIDQTICSNFGWYFGYLDASPTDPNYIAVHGVYLAVSRNLGSNWSYFPADSLFDVHVDFHAQAFSPDGTRQVWGNDGGLYLVPSDHSSATHVESIPITQYYAISADPSNPNRLLGGTQDNGTNYTRTGSLNDWRHIYWGDGFYCLVDPRYADSVYAEYQYGMLAKGSPLLNPWDWRSALDGIDDSDRRNWSTPVVMNPQNPNTLYYGTYRVYKTTDGALSWIPISGDLTGGRINSRYPSIATIAVSPLDTGIIWSGSDNGKVYRTMNGLNWSDVSVGLPQRSVTRIVCSPDSIEIAYVTLSGFRWSEDIAHVYRTSDLGATWVPIDGNLPDVPVNAMVIDPLNSSHLFIGNDIGVYHSTDLGQTWTLTGDGHPLVSVYDLHFQPTSRKLISGTHGYSMWSIDIDSVFNAAPEPIATPLTKSFSLGNAYPNPFNSTTSIRVTVSHPENFTVDVTDILGRSVEQLHRGVLTTGSHVIRWQPRGIATGTYWLRVTNGKTTFLRRAIYLK
ncbi:MAG: T9SS type A sorting domain-containing protein [bacterium]|nr:T9SS type A sorting domain-containing protein [bacterium]